ncbi:MAG: hypothetical protein WC503_03210 [Candidatus Shapirobacteria bacterium]
MKFTDKMPPNQFSNGSEFSQNVLNPSHQLQIRETKTPSTFTDNLPPLQCRIPTVAYSNYSIIYRVR